MFFTYRLNQDGLEHFFGCIRQMGACHQHPSPVAFKHRVRSHLLGKDALLASKCNVESCNGDMITSDSFFHSPVESEPSISSEEESLEKELNLSAMLFCLPADFESEEQNENEIEDETLEDAMEEGGCNMLQGI